MHRSIGACILAFLTCAGCDGGEQTPVAPTQRQAETPSVILPPVPVTGATDDPLVGRYGLTLDLGSECAAIPDEARVRRYTATIAAKPEGGYVVTLSGSTFLSGLICTFTVTGLDCNQFPASRNGDLVEFDLVNNNDDGHGGHIVEQLPSGT